MVTKEKLARINYLAKVSKSRELTDEEKSEQKALRDEYIKAFRKTFKKQLDSIEFVD
ncbi:DUF896 domain-containing protein [Alkaliphilus pronyensis]|uniref:UPF0291 protein F8154_11320 n=1 Tax=Alkaliphilus pronyensis TaxID=1482732 RepID=A0A6I0F6H5_9FIRM|nr:DUF896 domain-containing protein [Alkaliphilus pronyensis]KAB3532871.1 DUF896 domain-containing protein [Alkaliphilus pronyensis]